MSPDYHDFQRYLAAKVTVDDRALNKDVWRELVLATQAWRHRPLRVLDVGAGIATMAQRLWRWQLHPHILYTGVDLHPDNMQHARERLRAWAQSLHATLLTTATGIIIATPQQQMSISLEVADALAFVRRPEQRAAWDVLIAHAFLDLVDVASALPHLLATLHPQGLGYFTLNFDGLTLLEPVEHESFETHLMALYHRSMDERRVAGRPSGDSRTGRHLFQHLGRLGASIVAAGASDWVVFPREGAYPADEAFFLHAIIHTIHQELRGHPQVDGDRLDAWARTRHAQIDRGELLYIAHQLDYLVRPPA